MNQPDAISLIPCASLVILGAGVGLLNGDLAYLGIAGVVGLLSVRAGRPGLPLALALASIALVGFLPAQSTSLARKEYKTAYYLSVTGIAVLSLANRRRDEA